MQQKQPKTSQSPDLKPTQQLFSYKSKLNTERPTNKQQLAEKQQQITSVVETAPGDVHGFSISGFYRLQRIFI